MCRFSDPHLESVSRKGVPGHNPYQRSDRQFRPDQIWSTNQTPLILFNIHLLVCELNGTFHSHYHTFVILYPLRLRSRSTRILLTPFVSPQSKTPQQWFTPAPPRGATGRHLHPRPPGVRPGANQVSLSMSRALLFADDDPRHSSWSRSSSCFGLNLIAALPAPVRSSLVSTESLLSSTRMRECRNREVCLSAPGGSPHMMEVHRIYMLCADVSWVTGYAAAALHLRP